MLFETERVNVELPKLVKDPVTRIQLVKYAGASGDFNPIHTDEVFAKQSPLGGVIAHGMLSMGFLGQYLDQLAGDEAEVKNFKVRFRAMVRPGDVITCQSELKERSDNTFTFEIKAVNQKDEAVTLGEAIIVKKEIDK